MMFEKSRQNLDRSLCAIDLGIHDFWDRYRYELRIEKS
jgi:hypothetical protein